VAIDASAIPLRTWLFFGIVVLILSLWWKLIHAGLFRIIYLLGESDFILIQGRKSIPRIPEYHRNLWEYVGTERLWHHVLRWKWIWHLCSWMGLLTSCIKDIISGREWSLGETYKKSYWFMRSQRFPFHSVKYHISHLYS
jgi:hypothetical protein